jgi:adenylate cyclase
MNTQTNSAQNCLGYVLVVDDEAPNRMLLRDSLELHGYEVAEAEDGLRALKLIAARIPDVILLDVMMPGMHGFEVCQRLRQDVRTAPIPVLMVTALAERHERLMGIKVGATDFLTKPVDVQEVILRVGNAARSKQLYDQLEVERERSERLLRNLLPELVAQRMKAGETNIAELVPETTVLFADLVNFTTLAAHIGPHQVVFLLNELFSIFDGLVEARDLEKIKTVGDGYLVVGGVPAPRGDHAEAAVELALDMREAVAEFNAQYRSSIQIRIGICSGPVVAGVIGRKRLAYDVWGETVNSACQLGSTGQGGSIQVAPSTYERLPGCYRFDRANPGLVSVKAGGLGYRLISSTRDLEVVKGRSCHEPVPAA